METILTIVVLLALVVYFGYRLGGIKKQSKHDRLNIDELLKDAETDSRPDHDRPTLYKRLFNKK